MQLQPLLLSKANFDRRYKETRCHVKAVPVYEQVFSWISLQQLGN